MTKTNGAPAPSFPVPFNGRVIEMRKFTSREYVAIRKGDLDDVALIEMTLGAVVKDPAGDPWDLGPAEVSSLLAAWMEAATEAALPPETAPR